MAKKKLTVAEAARESGISYGTLHARLKKGWTMKKAMTTPVRAKKSNKPSPVIVSTPGETTATENATKDGSTTATERNIIFTVCVVIGLCLLAFYAR